MVRSAGFILLARTLAPTASFGVVYLLARIRGVELVGQFNTAMAVLALFQVFGGLGLENYLVREVARNPQEARELIRAATRAVLPICIATAAAAFLTALVTGYDRAVVEAVAAGCLVLVPSTLVTILDSVFIGLRRTRTVAIVSAAENALRLCLSISVIVLRPDVRLLLAVNAAARFAALLFYQVSVSGLPRVHVAGHGRLHFLRGMSAFIGILAVYSLFWRADILFLARLRGVTDAGIYSIAQKMVMIFFLVSSSVVSAVLPRLAQAREGSGFAAGFRHAFAFLAFYSVAVAAVLIVRGQELFDLLGLGTRFATSGSVLTVLALLIPLMSLIELCFRSLLAAGFEKECLRIGMRSLVVGLVLVGVAAWYGGVTWTAWAMVAAASFDLGQIGWRLGPLVDGLTEALARMILEAAALGVLLLAGSGLPLIPFLGLAAVGHVLLSRAFSVVKWTDVRAVLLTR
ncbi:MAG: oligosaccharide flippase family protein [Acidobacteria bacterium]|nr:oligosaccharide flippase family protein [Acidobacteriota bacterium]